MTWECSILTELRNYESLADVDGLRYIVVYIVHQLVKLSQVGDTKSSIYKCTTSSVHKVLTDNCKCLVNMKTLYRDISKTTSSTKSCLQKDMKEQGMKGSHLFQKTK